MILTALGTAGAFLQGISSLSFFWILLGMIHFYFLLIVYSLYQILDSEAQEKGCQPSARRQGYSQCHDPDVYEQIEKGNVGYQAAAFEETREEP